MMRNFSLTSRRLRLKHKMNYSDKIRIPFFIAVYLFVFYLVVQMLSPLFHAIAFGAIVAGTTYPVLNWLIKYLKFSRTTSSVILLLIINILLVLPSIYVLTSAYHELIHLAEMMTNESSAGVFSNYFFGTGEGAVFINKFFKTLGIAMSAVDIKLKVTTALQDLTSLGFVYVNTVLSNIFQFFFHYFVMLLSLFSLFQYGPQLRSFIFKMSPLPDDEEYLLMERFNQMNFITFVGNGVGGIIQATACTIVFYFMGVPSAFFWGTMMVFFAFLPLVGISVVFIPASIYLYLNGDKTSAILTFLICAFVSVIVENWFKPMFIGRSIKVNSIFILLCIIGGVSSFGFFGIFYGPALGIMFQTLGEFFNDKYYPKLRE